MLHRTTSRNRVAAELWPDLTPDRAAKNLRTTLNYDHEVLEPHRSSGDAAWFVRTDGQKITLHASLDVDLWRFTELLDRADDAELCGPPSEALPSLVEATRLWRGTSPPTSTTSSSTSTGSTFADGTYGPRAGPRSC